MECYAAITNSTAALELLDWLCKLLDPPKGEVSAAYVTVFKQNLNDFSFYLTIRLRARVFYEQIVNSAQSLVQKGGE